MATTQIHQELRFDISNRIAALLAERDAAAAYNARFTAIGVPSTGDGGTACTNQLGVAVAALSELLSAAAGDPDFGGIAPVIAPLVSSSVSAPRDIGTGEDGGTITLRVASLLPFPSLKLRPVVTGSDVDLVPFIKSIEWSKSTSPFAGAVGVVSVGTIVIGGVTEALSGAYKVVVQNPLDLTSSAVVSADSIYLRAP